MSRTYRAMKEEGARSQSRRLPGLCRSGLHQWEPMLSAGWFECGRCGGHAVCTHAPVVPRGVSQVACWASCARWEVQA